MMIEPHVSVVHFSVNVKIISILEAMFHVPFHVDVGGLLGFYREIIGVKHVYKTIFFCINTVKISCFQCHNRSKMPNFMGLCPEPHGTLQSISPNPLPDGPNWEFLANTLRRIFSVNCPSLKISVSELLVSVHLFTFEKSIQLILRIFQIS